MTISIIGTSHIAQESIERIKKAIEEKTPSCIAVELDLDRYHSLKEQQTGTERKKYIDKKNLLQYLTLTLLIKVQTKLSEYTGIGAGEEMLFAATHAEKKGIPVKLIDQHINTTILKLSGISTAERIKFLLYLIVGTISLPFIPFLSMFSKKKMDLNKVPEKEFVLELTGEFKKKFPQTYLVLVEERNTIMAEKIKKLGESYENIVVVVGIGHSEGLKEILGNQIVYQSKNVS